MLELESKCIQRKEREEQQRIDIELKERQDKEALPKTGFPNKVEKAILLNHF